MVLIPPRSCLAPELWGLFERTCADTKTEGARLDAHDRSVSHGIDNPARLRQIPRDSDAGRKPYTVDRTMFRSLLLLGLEENVRFGKQFERYTTTSTGVTAHFTDGTSHEGSLLVGAEGLRSPVRKQYLPEHRHVDTGTRIIYGKTPLTKEVVERFPGDAMHGMTVITDKKTTTLLTLFLEPMHFPNDAATESQGRMQTVDDYIYWVLVAAASAFGMPDSQLLSLSSEEAAQFTRDMTADWDPALKSLLELQQASQSSPSHSFCQAHHRALGVSGQSYLAR